MPEMCRNGRCAPISAHTASLRRSFRQKSHSRGWRRLDEAGQRDGGAHVGQRVVRGLVRDAVGLRQVLQLERRPAVLVLRPLDALGPQRPGGAHDVEQVPAAALVLPLARVRVDQVAPEQVARDLVVEADRVVADADRAGLRQRALDLGGERVLGQALLEAGLRHDAGEQAGLGVGQRIGRRAGSSASPAGRSRSGRHRCGCRRTAPGGRGAARGRRFRSRARRS